MKTLIIKQLERKIGNTELMIGTDVLKISLSLVRYINIFTFPFIDEKIVVHKWDSERSDRQGYERSEYPCL